MPLQSMGMVSLSSGSVGSLDGERRAGASPTFGRFAGGDASSRSVRLSLADVRKAIADRDCQIESLRLRQSEESEIVDALHAEIEADTSRRTALEQEAQQRGQTLRQLEERLRHVDELVADLEGSEEGEGRDELMILESEIRWMSARALQLHQKVHDLEGQLSQRFQTNDDHIRSIQDVLQAVVFGRT